MTNLRIVYLLGVLASTACSGGSDPGAAPMSQAGAGSIPLPPQAGISFSLAQSATATSNGQSCPIVGQTFDVGAPAAPTRTAPGNSLADGIDGAAIACAVKGAGPFTFSASIKATSTSAPSSPINIGFSGGQVTGSTGTATVSVYTPQLASTFTSDAACDIQVVDDQIQGGALWAQFFCPLVKSPPSGGCQLEGVVVLENCDGS